LEDGALVRNQAYGRVPPLRRVTAGRVNAGKAGITSPLYSLIEQRRPVLGFLNHPERYPELAELAYP
jgi:hypothetical protein